MEMTYRPQLVFLPEPQRFKARAGCYDVPARVTIGVGDSRLLALAREAVKLFPAAEVRVVLPRLRDALTLRIVAMRREGGYWLGVGPDGIRLDAADEAGARAGLQTLAQALKQTRRGRLPAFQITDWPDFPERGLYYDIGRGRVPTRTALLTQIDRLAEYKINHLQYYIEHTFAFRAHPDIGRGASPLTADDILALDDACAARGIELVPSLASFGHLSTVLHHPQYHHLAEDWGVGRYLDPEHETKRKWLKRNAWSLAPANPAIYPFLDSLFREFLPLFRSRRFNVCCDETLDLGLGQSYALCQRIGPGRLYLQHLLQVRRLAARYGKKIMFWGDMIRHYPKLIAEIPRDVTLLDWGYEGKHPFAKIADFKKAKVPFFACPGTSSWVSLFPRLPNAEANIAGFAAAGRKHGARGLLNTDWGDGGHYNFMEYSWYGYLFGAEQAWNTRASQATFPARFCRLFLGVDAPAFVRGLRLLAEVAQVHELAHYEQYWRHVFFSVPDQWAALTGRREAEVWQAGQIVKRRVTFDARYGRATLDKLVRVRRVLTKYAGRSGVDPAGVLPYWIFAVDTLACAARKLALLGPGGPQRPADRQALAREMVALRKRFEGLWMARNRRAEIRTTLKAYTKAIRGLRQTC
ncbi:MAG: glycoside hydrolase family 20 zincin-like fold domain-containing protein [bacterium]